MHGAESEALPRGGRDREPRGRPVQGQETLSRSRGVLGAATSSAECFGVFSLGLGLISQPHCLCEGY